MVLIRTNDVDQFNSIKDFFKEIEREMGDAILSHEETIKLFIDYREKGKLDAKEQLIKMNLRLVIKIAIQMMSSKYDLNDIIQEGNIGLIKAIEKYDYNGDVKFSTYAGKSIKQNIKRYVYNNKIIRMPEYITIAVNRIHRLEYELNKQVTYNEVKSVLPMNKQCIQVALEMSKRTISSYDCTEKDDGDNIICNTPDFNIIDFSKYVIKKELIDNLHSIMNEILEEKELTVLYSRFGLNGEEPKTLQAIADTMGRCKETVRRIEINSLKKLRAFLNANDLNFSDFI